MSSPAVATTSDRLPARADAVVVGAGHNGLVAATLLARAGLRVVVVEAADTLGGAARTEHPFPRVPGLGQSTGSYLLGLMPPELMAELDLELPLLRRDPHYFLPTLDERHLLLGADRAAARAQLARFFSDDDVAADDRLQAELAALRADVAPAWLHEPLSVEQTAERYVRPELRDVFVSLCRGSVADYLARFGFRSELLTAMYAVTDGLSGLHAGPDTPGSGHNFLVHNMCRLPGADGTWMIVAGGMGTVTQRLAGLARAAGAELLTGVPARLLPVSAGAVRGVDCAAAGSIEAPVVLGATDPFTLVDLLAPGSAPPALQQRVGGLRREGTTLKVNLALSGLPSFRCLPAGSASPFGSTIHLLAQDRPLQAVREMWAQVAAGGLPERPTIEWYLHTTVDPSLGDGTHHSSALFVQSVPYRPATGTWEDLLDGYVDRLLGICDEFAPGTSSLVADVFALPPPAIERHFGIRHGHIHHVDNCFAFADRMPYRTGVDGLYAAGAGCHPAGSVIGAAGRNAARCVLADAGRAPA